jgi:hypothetical protein
MFNGRITTTRRTLPNYTADVVVKAKYYVGGGYIFGNATQGLDSGYTTPKSFTANATGWVIIEVYVYQDETGDYEIRMY